MSTLPTEPDRSTGGAASAGAGSPAGETPGTPSTDSASPAGRTLRASASSPRGAGAAATGKAAALVTERYRRVRAATDALVAALSSEDCAIQSMPDVSPTKWHLAHTTWFFETFILEAEERDFRPFHPQYRVLFNSYYETVGPQHPRSRRGLLSRPSLEEVKAYRADVDRRVLALLAGSPSERSVAVARLGTEHEQQHQELLLTDIKHVLSCNPLRPAYRGAEAPGSVRRESAAAAEMQWIRFDEKTRRIGYGRDEAQDRAGNGVQGDDGSVAPGSGFSFDNESPRHRRLVPAFEIASRPVTCGEYLAFMEDGGYARPDLWLADGWGTIVAEKWQAPLYWQREEGPGGTGRPRAETGGGWHVFTLDGLRPVQPEDPVAHLSYYEAEAYARWAGARLPDEAEWETAAEGMPLEGNFVHSGRLHPAPAGAAATTAAAAGKSGGDARTPGEIAGPHLEQMFGDVWEWTRSPYAAYPGFRPPAGALGEYNGKFMCNQMVLRGGSCVSPQDHLRLTYRNFLYPHMRWQFSGLRLARDA